MTTPTPPKGGGTRREYSKSVNLVQSLFFRHLHAVKRPYSSRVSEPCYRLLVRRTLRRASSNARRVFKTQISGEIGVDINPVYDIQYSPRAYQDCRVIAVGDELGYLSIVKVGFEGGTGGGGKKRKEMVSIGGGCGVERVHNRGVQFVGTQQRQREDDSFEEEEEPPMIQPVLYTVAWNPDGNRILAGYGNGSIRIWDMARSSKPTCAATLHQFDKSLKRVAWCQETLISCSRTNEIVVHDLRMRNPMSNRIDCNLLGSKLTDISVLSDVYVMTSSSNQSAVNLFDLRYTYKLYKRIKPVQSFDLSSPGYTTMKYDKQADDGILYALGSDSIVRSVNFRTGSVGATYQVPGGVDFFTKIDVDKFSGILVSGGNGQSAWGFDLLEKSYEKGCHVKPFVELRERKGGSGLGEESANGGDDESDKENQPEGPGAGGDDDVRDPGCLRSSSAVALGTRRSFQDCAFQVACGGDNSNVFVYD